jgi:hypothetical protein
MIDHGSAALVLLPIHHCTYMSVNQQSEHLYNSIPPLALSSPAPSRVAFQHNLTGAMYLVGLAAMDMETALAMSATVRRKK